MGEIAAKTNCEIVRGDKDEKIKGIESFRYAAAGQLTFWVRESMSPSFLQGMKPAAIMVDKDLFDEVLKHLDESVAILKSPSGNESFINCLKLYQENYAREGAQSAHPAAIIHTEAKIGKDVRIGAGVVIGPRVVIAEGCYIGEGAVLEEDIEIGEGSAVHSAAVIKPRTWIGSGVIVESGSVIGGPGFGYMRYKDKHNWIPQLGGVILEDEVEIGPNTAVDRGTMPVEWPLKDKSIAGSGYTRIGAGSKLDNFCHIGHNVNIGKNCILCGRVAISGSAIIEDDCLFAGKSACIQGATVGAGTIVTAGGFVLHDVKPGSTIYGIRGQQKREYAREVMELKKLVRKGNK